MPKRFQNLLFPRWVHIDLGLTGDAAGVACGYVPGFTRITRSEVTETLPLIKFDFTLRVPPPPGGEINFAKIRTLLYKLREEGLPIRWVSFDSYQSQDSIQILNGKGFKAGLVSMDKTSLQYDLTKTAFYDNRVELPLHERAKIELLSLERIAKPNKWIIDHPPHGSKDISDAIAGVVSGVSRAIDVWVMHDIPLSEIPDSMKGGFVESKSEMEDESPRRTNKYAAA